MPPRPTTRRHLLFLGLGAGAGAGLGALLGQAGIARSAPARLRPPGAREEGRFLAACIRCGQCVEACPWGTLRLSDLTDGVGAGAPAFTPRRTPCWLCQGHDEARCIAACPTGALQPLADFRQAAMGMAHLDERRCLPYAGTTCRACSDVCPYPDEAIQFTSRLEPYVAPDMCIGCGLCEHACPTEPSSIVVRPLEGVWRA